MGKAWLVPGESVNLQMHRKLGPFEHLLWLVDQWTPRHFILVARLEGAPITLDDLRSALLESQRRHPILRTTILVNGDGDPEFIPSNAPIPVRIVRRTGATQWLHEAETQLSTPFGRDDQPLMRVVLVQSDEVSELILVVHHSIGDGVSAMFLVRDLLESMEGNWLEELAPRTAFEEFLGGGRGSSTGSSRGAAHSELASRLERPQKAILQILDIEPGEAGRIVGRARGEGTTLQGALLAALLLSLPDAESLRCLSPINIRRFVPPVVEDFGLYISSGMATLDSNAPADFWSLARSARQQVMEGFNAHTLQARAAGMASVIASEPSPQTAYEHVWRRIGYDAVLTNLGSFPKSPKLRRFRVTAAYPILSPELEPVVAVVSAEQHLYVTVSSPPALAGVGTRFLELLKQQGNQR